VSLSTAVLWVHVLAGVSWVGACGSFALAATALAGSGTERRDFVVRFVPRLNQLCIGCAGLILLTGFANLAFVARSHGNLLSREFTLIVTVKGVCFAIMAASLGQIIALTGTLRAEATDLDGEADTALGALRRLYGFTIGLGAIALLLGLWLAGIQP
jgi:hypothetical protein